MFPHPGFSPKKAALITQFNTKSRANTGKLN